MFMITNGGGEDTTSMHYQISPDVYNYCYCIDGFSSG